MAKRDEEGRGKRINAVAQRVKDAVFGTKDALSRDEMQEAMTGTIGVLAAMVYCNYNKSAKLPGPEVTLMLCEAMKNGAEEALDRMDLEPEQAAINRVANVMADLSEQACDGKLDLDKMAVLITEHKAGLSAEELLAENPLGGIKAARRAKEVADAFFDAVLDSLRESEDDGKRYDSTENN
jgi:hypothetical protein